MVQDEAEERLGNAECKMQNADNIPFAISIPALICILNSAF
jgi:hypothetical protein